MAMQIMKLRPEELSKKIDAVVRLQEQLAYKSGYGVRNLIKANLLSDSNQLGILEAEMEDYLKSY